MINEIINKPTDKLIPYAGNPKQHPAGQVDKIAASIKNYGFTVPMVIGGNSEIIMGHGRLQAAKKLGLSEVPCIVRDDLTESQVKALRIADNKVSESEWNIDLLLAELGGLDEFTGFDEEEISKFIKDPGDKKNEPEKIFTPELFEEHNYIVLYFDNTLDWQTACEKLEIKIKHAIDSKDGYERKGIGRVVRGADVVARID